MKSIYNVPKPQRWTLSAIECYKRGCVCDGCFYQYFFKGPNRKCQMKGSVIELVKEFGIPKGGTNEQI